MEPDTFQQNTPKHVKHERMLSFPFPSACHTPVCLLTMVMMPAAARRSHLVPLDLTKQATVYSYSA